jgi:hypothetical protein
MGNSQLLLSHQAMTVLQQQTRPVDLQQQLQQQQQT